MKILHYPYLMTDENWGATANLVNTGINTEVVKVTFRKDNSCIAHIYYLAPNERLTIDDETLAGVAGEGLFSINIMSSDFVTGIVGLYMKDISGIKFFNIMPAVDMSEHPYCLYAGAGYAVDMAVDNRYYGVPAGKYLSYHYGCIVDYCLSYDYINNGGQLVIGDCCPNDGSNLEGHPGSSHAGIAVGGGRAFDMNYPRHDGGYTQFRPSGVNATPIFLDGGNGELLSNHFNHIRFMDFLWRLRRHFPQMTARVDIRIKTFLESQYGTLPYIQGDNPMEYNHHAHAHIDLGVKING